MKATFASSPCARRALVGAIVVNVPLLAFLLDYWQGTPERFFTYRLPVLHDFPKGWPVDLALVLVAILAWLVVRNMRLARRTLLVFLVPVAIFVVVFRFLDHYYELATQLPLNIYVLYGNLARVQEGVGVVRSAPAFALLLIALAIHYLLLAVSARYAARLGRLADACDARPRAIVASGFAFAIALIIVDAQAVWRNPRPVAALMSLSGEYVLLRDLPNFIREKVGEQTLVAHRPGRLVLPEHRPPASLISRSTRRHPDVILVTVESFNAAYTLPPAQLHAGLLDPLMPFFDSLSAEGISFARAYTSSAYTFNGILAVMCSQYTMSEVVWGSGCLPEALRRSGYRAVSLMSINQLRPYRYDMFTALGFDRSRVFDAVRMRAGRRNVDFSFMHDHELFAFAEAVADSVAKLPGRAPLFLHLSTNSMHVPGYVSRATCAPYSFPPGMEVEPLTRSMIDAAHCTDHELGAFFAHLKQAGLYDDALIIVTADHAFNIAFWDRHESELARIPLVIKFPRNTVLGQAIDTAQVVGQVDLAPTILDFLGIASDRPMYGRSLLGAAPAGPRRLDGISSSRLVSMAERAGFSQHMHGQADLDDDALRAELDRFYDTVLYFDQHPWEFAPSVRAAWTARPATVAATH